MIIHQMMYRITIVFKDGEVRTYQPSDDWEDTLFCCNQ